MYVVTYIVIFKCMSVVPVHVCQGLVKRVLSNPFVSREVTTPAACVGKLISPVLQQITQIKTKSSAYCTKGQFKSGDKQITNSPLHPQSPQPRPVNKNHHYCVHGYRRHVACGHLPHSPEGEKRILDNTETP